jgi:hypothetical protein
MVRFSECLYVYPLKITHLHSCYMKVNMKRHTEHDRRSKATPVPLTMIADAYYAGDVCVQTCRTVLYIPMVRCHLPKHWSFIMS